MSFCISSFFVVVVGDESMYLLVTIITERKKREKNVKLNDLKQILKIFDIEQIRKTETDRSDPLYLPLSLYACIRSLM